jgi:hypothetical protein
VRFLEFIGQLLADFGVESAIVAAVLGALGSLWYAITKQPPP